MYLDLLYLQNIALAIVGQLLLHERGVPRVWRIENVVDFLQRAVLGLWDEEPNNKCLDGAPASKDNVQSPANVFQGDGVRELVDQYGCSQRKLAECHALGTYLEREHLDWIESLEGRDTKGEDGVEQDNHCDKGIASRNAVVLVLIRNSANSTGPDKGDDAECSYQHGSAAEFINARCTDDSL